MCSFPFLRFLGWRLRFDLKNFPDEELDAVLIEPKAFGKGRKLYFLLAHARTPKGKYCKRVP
jgi:hypothetical protein